MTTAAEIALHTYHERQRQIAQERQEREYQEAERKQREHENNRRKALGRLKRSLLPEWFPDVEWEFVETLTLPSFGDSNVVRDVWSNGEGRQRIRLMVEDHPDLIPLKVTLVTGHNDRTSGSNRWQTIPVNGPEEIGRYLADLAQQESDYYRSHPD